MKFLVFELSAEMLPTNEWQMIREVATKYELTEEQTWLLAAIRVHENGRPGLEFGVGGQMNSRHPSHRYQDGIKSFYLQCEYAAGTIKKRYVNLKQFAKRYCPKNAVQWEKNIRSIINRLKFKYKCKLPH